MKDDVAMTRKMINRGTETFYCLSCLADHFELTEDILREKIKEFRAMGCTLFQSSRHKHRTRSFRALCFFDLHELFYGLYHQSTDVTVPFWLI